MSKTNPRFYLIVKKFTIIINKIFIMNLGMMMRYYEMILLIDIKN
jgi:hypothetical protein